MGDTIEKAVLRVIETMRERLGEPLTIDEMARTAMFSKFHFTRIFLRVTGLSPGRFLSAMRIQKAQELLVTTSLNVADIAYEVGYNSVGTFSSRFTRSVGLSPSAYRRFGGFAPEVRVSRSDNEHQPPGTLRGSILSPLTGHLGHIFLGLFPDQVPRSGPVACMVLERPGPYLLKDVPPGTWHLVATSIATDRDGSSEERTTPDRAPSKTLYVARYADVAVPAGAVVPFPDVRLRPSRVVDPPVLLAMPDVRTDVPEQSPHRDRLPTVEQTPKDPAA